MRKNLRNQIKDVLPKDSSKELIDSVHKFVLGREKLAFISARIPKTFGDDPKTYYHYKDENEYLNTPE